MKKFEIYDPESDITMYESDDEKQLLEVAGNYADDGFGNYQVIEHIGDRETAYNILEFIEFFTPFSDVVDMPNAEMFHNLDEAEQIEVLKFVPDRLLLSEMNRRMNEYRKFADHIRECNEDLRIYV